MVKKHRNSIIEAEEKAMKKFGFRRDTYANKYPLVFALGATFGLVSTFYGFEKLIDRFDIFTDNPWILLGTGLIALMVTGRFYNKLS